MSLPTISSLIWLNCKWSYHIPFSPYMYFFILLWLSSSLINKSATCMSDFTHSTVTTLLSTLFPLTLPSQFSFLWQSGFNGHFQCYTFHFYSPLWSAPIISSYCFSSKMQYHSLHASIKLNASGQIGFDTPFFQSKVQALSFLGSPQPQLKISFTMLLKEASAYNSMKMDQSFSLVTIDFSVLITYLIPF